MKMSIHSSTLLQTAIKELLRAHIQNPEFEAELLLAHLLNIPKTHLCSYDFEINDALQAQFHALINKRKTHYPIQYLLGEWEFWSISLSVSENVFIPRPETETLIELALEYKKSNFSAIIDLGTGSGNISLALAKEFETIPVFAVDISEYALHTAQHNTRLHNMHDRIHFVQSDFLSALNPNAFTPPLLILSNPPYIAAHEVDSLMDEIKLYEPATSYLADKGGLDCYLKIFHQLNRWCLSALYLIFEIAPQLKDALINIANKFKFSLQAIKNDLQGNPRALLFYRGQQ